MISIQIKEVKPFMNRLFLTDYFDAFYVSEASFTTFSTFHIDGLLKKEYYTQEELEEHHMEQQTHALWRQIRPFCLDLVRGTHTPLEFKLIFRLSPSNTEKLMKQNGIPLSVQDIHGLFLNIHFQTGSLTCITGTSLGVFSLDKTLDQTWDRMVQKFLSDFVSTHLN